MELCKSCIFYNSEKETCAKYVTAAARGRKFEGSAAAVRKDPTKCGPSARFFFRRPSPILAARDEDDRDYFFDEF